MEKQRQIVARLADLGSDYNALVFLIKQILSQEVCTAIPVRVDTVERAGTGAGAGTLSATPLVSQTDASGNLIAPVSIPRLPYFRLRHGTAAIVCDPKPGDVGLAIFAQQDCSNVRGGADPVVPGSFRSFDMSDGFYLGGLFGPPPTTFIHIEDSGHVHVKAIVKVQVDAPDIEMNAGKKTVINGPQTIINSADIQLNGAVSAGGSDGAAAHFSGSVTADGDVKGQGTSLHTHTHGGVQGGPSNTGQPN